MWKGLVGVVVVAGGLVLALVMSQARTEPRRVSGFVEAHEIRVGSRVGGRVARVLVKEGEGVKAGQPLVVLDPYDLKERRSRAEADLKSRAAFLAKLLAGNRKEEIAKAKADRDAAAANLADLEAGPRKQEIAAARADVAAAKAALDLARAEHERVLRLAKSDVETQKSLDRATEQLRSAQSGLAAKQAALALLLAGTRPDEIAGARAKLAAAQQAVELAEAGARSEDVAAAKAGVAAAKASIAVIDRQIAELEVRAPADTRVEALDIEPGDMVAPSAPVLALMDLKTLWVRAYVPEDELDVRIGRKVWVTVDSYPGKRFQARITFIATEAEFTPNNVQTPKDRAKQVFRIKATLVTGLDALRPGMAADVWLDAPPPDTTAWRR